MECARHPRVVQKKKSAVRTLHMLHYNTEVSVPLIHDTLQSHGNIQRYFLKNILVKQTAKLLLYNTPQACNYVYHLGNQSITSPSAFPCQSLL